MIPIIYENDEIYIINKPAGLAVQGGQGVTHSLDVEFPKQVGSKVHLVHRLDKDTSGLMIVAKNPAAAGKWTKIGFFCGLTIILLYVLLVFVFGVAIFNEAKRSGFYYY